MRSKVPVISLVLALVLAACTRPHAAPRPAPGPGVTTTDAGRDSESAGARVGKPSAVAPLDQEGACAFAPSKVGAGRPGASKFERETGSCLTADPFCDTVDVAPPGADACFVANTNVTRAERESRAHGRPASLASAPWDRAKSPKYWQKVDAHLHFDAAESALLRANGFVVLERERRDNYAVAFHDIFQQQLPLFVSVDSVFHAVFRSTETLLAEVEKATLGPKLARAIDRMRATLAQSRGAYDSETVDDLDLYLVVAHRLLHDRDRGATAKKPAVEAAVTVLVESAEKDGGLATVELFGRPRVIDFSQYTPRGHYAGGGYDDTFEYGKDKESIGRPAYFRAMTWLSRLEWNLASRSCRSSQPGDVPDPSETPREARDAIALADLVARSGVTADLQAFEDVYSVFGGKREDVPLAAVSAMAAKAGIGARDPEAPAKLRAAIGNGYKRTARTHYMPSGASELPAIATMFGPRIVPDVAPLTHLVEDSVANRFSLGAADVAYVLGHDRAKEALAADLRAFPDLGPALERARADVANGVRGKSDVYSTWLAATLRVADSPAGAVPSFMMSAAYADMKRSSALAAYAQIRHTYVLMAAQGYDAYGCEIPDAYVEPAIGAWDGLLAWARAARAAVPSHAKYFRRVEEVLSMLRGIAATELAGAPLSEPQRRWLAMVSEIIPVGGYGGDSGAPPRYTGWYFELFPDREIGAVKSVDLVADYFTLTNAGEVRYLGVDAAMLGAFVVDVGGEPRVMVGPVTRPYEATTRLDAPRLDDAAAESATVEKRAPWLTSYVAPETPGPELDTRTYVCGSEVRVVVTAEQEVGEVTVAPLDHHGDPIAEPVTLHVGRELAVFAFLVPGEAVEGIDVRAKSTGRGRRERMLHGRPPGGIGGVAH